MKKTAFIIALAVGVAMLSGLALAVSDAEFQKAVDYYKVGQYEDAVRVLEQYVSERPKGSAYYLLGYANYALGKEDEAARNFRDAYLVDPEFSPGEFRRSIGIDIGVPPKSPPRPRAEAAAPSAPAVKAAEAPKEPVAPAPPPVQAAPKAVPEAAPEPAPPAPRFVPSPLAPETPIPIPTEFIAALGLIPMVVGLALYFYFSLCLFLIARKTDVAAAWLAFVPILQLWPVVGAAGKSALWIVLLLIPFLNIIIVIYLWMLIAERLGRGKIFGLLIALIPVVNLVLLGLLAFKGQAAPSGRSRFDFPGMADEYGPLPDVPGMEGEESSFEETGPFEGTPPFEEPFEERPPEEKAAAEEEVMPTEEISEKEFDEFIEAGGEVPEEFMEEDEKSKGEAEEFEPFEELPSEEEPPRPF